MRAHVPTCFHAVAVDVTTCLRSSVVYVLIFTCKRDIWCASVSTWCVKLPKGVPIGQTFLLQNAVGIFYTLLLYKNSTLYLILQLYVSHVYVLYKKNLLYFISTLHVILKEIVEFFFFINCFLFCCLVTNENIKSSGFYTLQVTRAFENFPYLKCDYG